MKAKERKKIEKNTRRFEKFLDKEAAKNRKFEEKYGNPELKAIVDKWKKELPQLSVLYRGYKSDERKSDILHKFYVLQSIIGIVFMLLWLFTSLPSTAVCGLLFLVNSAGSGSEARAFYLRARIKGMTITTANAVNNIPDKITSVLSEKYKVEKKK